MRKRLCLIILALMGMSAGCASPPISTTLTAVMQNPDQYRNERVALTAPVLSNPQPQGDLYRTWNFVIGSPDVGRILVTEAGYNPSTINKAYQLVAEARETGEPITVVGRFRVGPYKSLREGAEIDLDSVTYRNITVNTDEGPYVGGYYSPYYYYPPFYHPSPFWGYRYRYYPYGYGWWGKYIAPDQNHAGDLYAGHMYSAQLSASDEEPNKDAASPAQPDSR